MQLQTWSRGWASSWSATMVYAILLGTVGASSTFARLLVYGLAEGIFFVFAQILAAGLYRGALRVADGQDFKVGDMFEGYDKAQVVIAALLIAIGTAIGTARCYIPGLIVGFMTFFTIMFVVDQHLSAWDAIKASVQAGHRDPRQHPAVLHPRRPDPAGQRLHLRRRAARRHPGRPAGARLHLPATARPAGRALTHLS